MLEPSSTPSDGWFGGSGYPGRGISQLYAPILFGGALWTVLQEATSGPSRAYHVYRSADGGATWARQDAANAPAAALEPTPIASFCFDGAHSIIVIWSPASDLTFNISGPVQIQSFDMLAGTWSAPYGIAGAPVIYCISQCYVRPDGSLAVFTCDGLVGSVLQDFTAHVYSGGVWSFSLLVDTNQPAGNHTAACSSVMDSSGNIYLFLLSDDGLGTITIFLQIFESGNILGPSAIAGTYTSATGLPGVQPAIAGTNLIYGLVDPTGTYATASVSNSLTAPVFAEIASPGIDQLPPAGGNAFAPSFAADATGVYAAYVLNLGSGEQQIRYSFTPNLTDPSLGWTPGIVIYDDSVTEDVDRIGLLRAGGATYMLFTDGIGTGATEPTAFFSMTMPVSAATARGSIVNSADLHVVALPNPALC